MKPILAFDSACTGASIALLVHGKTDVRALEQSQQAAVLVPTIDALLKENGVDYADLGCIVSTIGPGSFTGVRIGLAALHGFVLVNHTPIKLVSTLEAMAWQVAQATNAPTDFMMTLRAGKGEVYAQPFSIRAGIPQPTANIFLAPETTTEWNMPCYGHSGELIAGPDAALLCTIAEQLPIRTLTEAVPLYIRAPDAIAPAPLAWLTQA